MKIPDPLGVRLGIREDPCPFLGRTLERWEDQENVVYLDLEARESHQVPSVEGEET